MNLDTILEDVLAKAEQGDLESQAFYHSLATDQPEIFTFLFDEDTRLLIEQEHDYLLFLAMVIIQTLVNHGNDLNTVELDTLEDMAEYNWGLLEHTSIENITETLSEHPGFPLYAFLDDACAPVEGHEILSEAAVELVYVKCKALVDSAVLKS